MSVLAFLLFVLVVMGILLGIPILLARSILQHRQMADMEQRMDRLLRRLEDLERNASSSPSQPDDPAADRVGGQQSAPRPAPQEDGTDQPLPAGEAPSSSALSDTPKTAREIAEPQGLDSDRIIGETDASKQDKAQSQPPSSTMSGAVPPVIRPPANAAGQ